MKDLKSRSSIFSIIVLVAGLVGIISLFLTWESFSLGSFSGWDYITAVFNSPYVIYTEWVPLFVLIFSVVATIFAALVFFKPRMEFGVIIIISGIFWVIAAAVFIMYTEPSYRMIDHAGIGFYLAFIAGIILLVFGILRMAVKDK